MSDRLVVVLAAKIGNILSGLGDSPRMLSAWVEGKQGQTARLLLVGRSGLAGRAKHGKATCQSALPPGRGRAWRTDAAFLKTMRASNKRAPVSALEFGAEARHGLLQGFHELWRTRLRLPRPWGNVQRGGDGMGLDLASAAIRFGLAGALFSISTSRELQSR